MVAAALSSLGPQGSCSAEFPAGFDPEVPPDPHQGRGPPQAPEKEGLGEGLVHPQSWVVAAAAAAVVEVEEVADVEILTMIEDMIVGTTDMKTMITGTEEDHLLLITVDTDHDQDLDPTAQDAINKQSGRS